MLNRRLVAGLLVVLSLAVLGAVIFGTRSTKREGVPATPTMTTPVPFACHGPPREGGRRIEYYAVLITPPVGHVYDWTASGNWIRICVDEDAAMIVIDWMTGAEIQRNVNDPAAVTVLDQIAQSVQINPNPTPTIGPRPVQPDPTRPWEMPLLALLALWGAGLVLFTIGRKGESPGIWLPIIGLFIIVSIFSFVISQIG
jgi:hypothetical protein